MVLYSGRSLVGRSIFAAATSPKIFRGVSPAKSRRLYIQMARNPSRENSLSLRIMSPLRRCTAQNIIMLNALPSGEERPGAECADQTYQVADDDISVRGLERTDAIPPPPPPLLA